MFQKLRIYERYVQNLPLAFISSRLTRSIRKVTCWQCGTENSANFFCQSCNVLQEPDSKQNYFDVFGLQLSYNLNNSDLVSKYHKLQIVFHPDKHSNKSEREKQISESYSMLVNKAYSTLSNPLQRGLYILKMKGTPLDEEGISSDDRQFFLEILEWDDEIDSMRNREEAEKISDKLNNILTDLTKEITEAFDKNNTGEARILLNKMKYYNNIWQKFKTKKQNLGIPD